MEKRPTLAEVRERLRNLLLEAHFRSVEQGSETTDPRCPISDFCGEGGFDICARFDEPIIEIEHTWSCRCRRNNPSVEDDAIKMRWLEMYQLLLQQHGYTGLIVHQQPGQMPVLRMLVTCAQTSSRLLDEVKALHPPNLF